VTARRQPVVNALKILALQAGVLHHLTS